VVDLFLGDLSGMTTADVEAFLALNTPEDQRPKETNRLDFKESFTTDIGDAVSALANTYGGLILIGVKADKTKQNVPVDIPGANNLGSDAKARITDTVLATVRPRPIIDIGIADGRTSGGTLAVVRVSEGTYPPYEFQSGTRIRIPVRVQDTNRQATLREIEALLEKRGHAAKPAKEIAAPYIDPSDLMVREAGFHRT
jgi:predicted HTH transcriptional regulator